MVTERHVASFALASPTELRETKSFAEQVRSKLSVLGDVCFFEHGPSADLAITAGCGIDHAHLHALPIPCSHFEPVLQEHEFETIEDLSSVGQAVGDEAYLYVETRNFGSRVARVHDRASQTIRRSLAQSLGRDHAENWRDQLLFPEEFGTRAAVEMSLGLLRDMDDSAVLAVPRLDEG